MTTPKTIIIIECRRCRGQFFGNDTRLSLSPGDEHNLPDELAIAVRKVAKCTSCKMNEDRTMGSTGRRRLRYDR